MRQWWLGWGVTNLQSPCQHCHRFPQVLYSHPFHMDQGANPGLCSSGHGAVCFEVGQSLSALLLNLTHQQSEEGLSKAYSLWPLAQSTFHDQDSQAFCAYYGDTEKAQRATLCHSAKVFILESVEYFPDSISKYSSELALTKASSGQNMRKQFRLMNIRRIDSEACLKEPRDCGFIFASVSPVNQSLEEQCKL